MAAVELGDVVYVVDENLLRLGKGILAIRRDTARFGEDPVADLVPEGIEDPDWIPVIGDNGWILITNDRRLRTRPVEAPLAVKHRLKVVHLHGKIGHATAWEQLTRLTARWAAIEKHAQSNPQGPWWLSLRPNRVLPMRYEPGKVER